MKQALQVLRTCSWELDMAGDPVTAIANAIAEGSKLFHKMLATRKVRHLKAAIDAGERYIHVNEGFGENSNLTVEAKAKLLKKFRARFFKYN